MFDPESKVITSISFRKNEATGNIEIFLDFSVNPQGGDYRTWTHYTAKPVSIELEHYRAKPVSIELQEVELYSESVEPFLQLPIAWMQENSVGKLGDIE